MQSDQSIVRIQVLESRQSLSLKLRGKTGLHVQQMQPTARTEDLAKDRPHLIAISHDVASAQALEICSAIRSHPQLNQVMLVRFGSLDGGTEEILSFEAGVDDYVGRTSSAAAIEARIKGIMRRVQPHPDVESQTESAVLTVGRLSVKPDSYTAYTNGHMVSLTAGEFRMLWKLARNVGRILSPAQLVDQQHALYAMPSERTIRSRVFTLRRKLGPCGSQIQTIRHAGYRLIE